MRRVRLLDAPRFPTLFLRRGPAARAMPGRAQVNIRLPAQLGRSVKVAVPRRGVSPISQAAVVNARLTAGLLERTIGCLLPRLAGRGQPVPGLGRPRFPRAALLRRLRVVAFEPLLGGPRDPVIATLGEHQVRVRVLAIHAAAVEGERIGQPLPGAHSLGECARECLPAGRVQFARQSELDLAVKPPVGALVVVRGLPVGARVLLGPRRHMPALSVLQFVLVPLVAALALDVVALGRRRLPTCAGPIADFEVIDRHAVTSVLVFMHAVFSQRNGNSAPFTVILVLLAAHHRCRI